MLFREKYENCYKLFKDFESGRISIKDFFSGLDKLSIYYPVVDINSFASDSYFTSIVGKVGKNSKNYFKQVLYSFLNGEVSYEYVRRALNGCEFDEKKFDYGNNPEGLNATAVISAFKKYYFNGLIDSSMLRNSFISDVRSSVLYKKVYDNYIKLLNKQITINEYLKFVDELEMDIKSYHKIAVDYCKNVKSMSVDDIHLLEDDFIFEVFMQFFDHSITFDELSKSIYSFRKGFRGSASEFIDSFINLYKEYAKDKYDIVDLNKFVMNKKLYRDLFNTYESYIKDDSDLLEKDFFKKFEEEGICSNSIHNMIYSYCTDILHLSDKEIDELRLSKINRANVILDKIELSNSSEEILNILTIYGKYESLGVKYGNDELSLLKSKAHNYLIDKYGESIDSKKHFEILEMIRSKINNVMIYYDGIKKQEENAKRVEERNNKLNGMLTAASAIVNDFILSNTTIKNYIASKNMSRHDFDSFLLSVKQFDKELFNRYQSHINDSQSQNFAVIISCVKKTVDYIKNGIVNEETNEKRGFDALDYYCFSKLSVDDFKNIVRVNCSKDDIRVVLTFFAKNKAMLNNNITSIRNTSYMFKDRPLSEDEKEEILNYLSSINAPYSSKLFDIALRRYIKNELILSDNNKLTLINK